MDYIYIGDIVNTHGVKGEVRLLSDFKYKKEVFIPGMVLYVGRGKEPLKIRTYRPHKMFDMVTFDGIDNINDVIMYKGDQAFIKKEQFQPSGILNEDLIGIDVFFGEQLLGQVDYIMTSKAHEIIVVTGKTFKTMIPYVDEFIVSIDIDSNKIVVKNVEGLITNED